MLELANVLFEYFAIFAIEISVEYFASDIGLEVTLKYLLRRDCGIL